jgi:hypothetical protein
MVVALGSQPQTDTLDAASSTTPPDASVAKNWRSGMRKPLRNT